MSGEPLAREFDTTQGESGISAEDFRSLEGCLKILLEGSGGSMFEMPDEVQSLLDATGADSLSDVSHRLERLIELVREEAELRDGADSMPEDTSSGHDQAE